MKLKTKLYLSFAFLFSLIVLLSGLGSYFLGRLAEDSKAITEDNYQTLGYMHNIHEGLDKVFSLLPQDVPEVRLDEMLDSCKSSIDKQLSNITEPGEQKLSNELRAEFETLVQDINTAKARSGFDTSYYIQVVVPQLTRVKDLSSKIYTLNEETLLRKNMQANQTAEKVILYMAVFGISGVIISLLFILGIPSILFNPLLKLNEGIKQIASQNYSHQLPVKGRDELGEIASSFNHMAKRLYEYDRSNYARLLSEKKRIEAIINQMHEAIIGIDESHKILFANNLAREFLNLPEERIKGKSIESLAASNDFVHSIVSDFSPESRESLEAKSVRIIHKGKEKLFSREIIPVSIRRPEDKNRVNIGYVVVLTDITSFSEKDKAKTHFIATISHELKTPISSMIMSLKLLQDGRAGALNSDQRELINSIKGDSNRLLKITGELLEMAQVETGNIQLDIKPVDPVHIVDVSVHAMQQQAKAKGIHIIRKVETNEQVLGDGDKTTWVLINFLSNAIRYSQEGSDIILNVSKTGDGKIKFSVQDFGPGIDPKFQERLFEKYYKVPGSRQSGTGLGLAISKEFIKAMGGEIGVDSIPGQGSTFYFLLAI